MREKILFCGTSNMIGLGLDLELGDRYNDVKWLKENGVISPFIRVASDNEIIEQYRWPTLVSNYFNFNEIKHSDIDNIFDLNRVNKTLETLFTLSSSETSDIKHIFLETSHIFRLDLADGTQLTSAEMINLINNPATDKKIINRIYSFLDEYDETARYQSFIELFQMVKDIHKHIKFHLLVWHGISNDIIEHLLYSIKENIVSITIENETSTNIQYLLNKYKLTVSDTAFCYVNNIDSDGNKIWDTGDYVDIHANKLGHELIAKNIIERIKNIY
jgi:replication initiation and membrane attachment protein DnaB